MHLKVPCRMITTTPLCTEGVNVRRCTWNPVHHKCSPIRNRTGVGAKGQSLVRFQSPRKSPTKSSTKSSKKSPTKSSTKSPTKSSKKSPTKSSTKSSKKSHTKSSKTLGKRKLGWKCSHCNTLNVGMGRSCTECGSLRPQGALKSLI